MNNNQQLKHSTFNRRRGTPPSRTRAVATLLAFVLVAMGIAACGNRGTYQTSVGQGGQAANAADMAAMPRIPITSVPAGGGRGGGGVIGDDYPWANIPQDSKLDPWLEYVRECTSFAAWRLHSSNGFEMPFHANAKDWGPLARDRGFRVDDDPKPGAVAWTTRGGFGHVAVVAAVDGDRVTIEQYNADFHGHYSTQVVAASSFSYIHFKDLPDGAPAAAPPAPTQVQPAAGIDQAAATTLQAGDQPVLQAPAQTVQQPGGSGAAPSTTAAPTTAPPQTTTTTTSAPPPTTTTAAPPPPPPATHREQMGKWGANSFTNPHNASGMGPRIQPGQWVEVSCKVYAPEIESARPDGYWYRLASSPWNDGFYTPANTFMNGDPWDGPYTRPTDWSVPDC